MGLVTPMMGRALIGLLAAVATLAAQADPAAWRVRGSGTGEVVLLGSVHSLRDSDYPLPASVDALYQAADTLVMELDLDDIDVAAIQSALLRAAMLPAETRLAGVLDPAIYEAAENHARGLGMDLALLDRFEPWLVAITLLDLGMAQLGYRSDRGLEQYLLGQARRDGIEVLGLETLATQVAVFDGLSLEEQSALLEQTLGELESAEAVMDDMIAAWRDGRLDAITDSLLDEFAEFPDLYKSLVVERNTAWTGEIERLLAGDSRYLIVVGGLHLVGDDSVVRMLRSRGYDVQRLAY